MATYREAQQRRNAQRLERRIYKILDAQADGFLDREARAIDTLYRQNGRGLNTSRASVKSKNKAKLSYICLEAKQRTITKPAVTKDVERSRETLQDFLSKSANGPALVRAMRLV